MKLKLISTAMTPLTARQYLAAFAEIKPECQKLGLLCWLQFNTLLAPTLPPFLSVVLFYCCSKFRAHLCQSDDTINGRSLQPSKGIQAFTIRPQLSPSNFKILMRRRIRDGSRKFPDLHLFWHFLYYAHFVSTVI